MSWLQVHLTTDREQAPLMERLLEELGALSVTFGDAADEALLEPPPGALPLWRSTRVTGLFPGETDADALRSALHRRLQHDPGAALQLEVLEDRTWERVWLERFHPMRFGRRLWVCPDGQRPEAAEDGVFLDLDPGLAFGTGTHPTTALCLTWLDDAGLDDSVVLDFGCGSGILAIAALKLGARRAIAVDHDPQALEATRANAVRNDVLERLEILPSDRLPPQGADLLLANILAGTLIGLEPVLAAQLDSGGRIALSGILADQASEVAQAFDADFRLEPPRRQEEWILIEGRRR